MKSEPNFVEKLWLKIHCGKPNFARQIKFAWQWKAENQTLWINVALSFKFRKYKTAFNNGLKIWLLPDFPAENPLLNGMFCYFCNGLVLHLRHIFKPQNVKCNIFSELTQNASLLFFRLIIFKKLAENFCVISEIWTELCRKTLCWKYVAWNQSLREKPSLRENGKLKTNFAFKRCIVYQVPKI